MVMLHWFGLLAEGLDPRLPGGVVTSRSKVVVCVGGGGPE